MQFTKIDSSIIDAKESKLVNKPDVGHVLAVSVNILHIQYICCISNTVFFFCRGRDFVPCLPSVVFNR